MYSTSDIIFHIITMISFIVIIIMFLYLTVKLSKVEYIIKNRLLNNTYKDLLEVMYKRMRDIGTGTLAESILIDYIKYKVNNIYNGYKQIKLNGFKLLKDPQFVRTFLSDGRMLLEQKYDKFPEEFLNKINSINQTNFNEFVNVLEGEVLDDKITRKFEFLELLKTHTIGVTDKNIYSIVKLFNDTKHLIEDDNFLVMYPEFKNKVVLKENIKTEYIRYKDIAQLDISQIKGMIGTGKSELIEEAIHLLNMFVKLKNNNQLSNVLYVLSSRFIEWYRKSLTGVNNDEEIINIKTSILEIIDKLK